MVCFKCGFTAPSGAGFCPACGTNLTGQPQETNSPSLPDKSRRRAGSALRNALLILCAALLMAILVLLLVLKQPSSPPPPSAGPAQTAPGTIASTVPSESTFTSALPPSRPATSLSFTGGITSGEFQVVTTSCSRETSNGNPFTFQFTGRLGGDTAGFLIRGSGQPSGPLILGDGAASDWYVSLSDNGSYYWEAPLDRYNRMQGQPVGNGTLTVDLSSSGA